MGIIYKRPVVTFCIMIVSGIITAFVSNSIAAAISLSVLIFVIVFSFGNIKGKGRYVLMTVVMLAFFLLGAVRFILVVRHQLSCFEAYDTEEVTIRGNIASAPEVKNGKVSYTVQVNGIRRGFRGEFTDLRGKILLSSLLDGNHGFFDYGREVTFEGTLTQPKGVRNPGGFDYKMYLAQKGVGASVFAYPYAIEKGEGIKGNLFMKAGLDIRNSIVHVIENSLPGQQQQAGLLNGMLIGYREGLSDEVREAFSEAGLMHIMAVSGANIAFMIIPLSLLLKLLRIRKRAANLLIMAFLNLFVCITGFEPSVLRAVFMACVLLLSSMLYRDPDVYSAIAVSCIIMLIINPITLFNIGFQLSYAATLGIVMLYKNISRLLSCRFIPKMVAEVLGVTLAAQIGVLPVTLIHFNKVSLISIIPNILAAPLLEIITVLGALMALLGQFSLSLSILIGYINNILLTVILYITKWSSSVPYASISTVTPPLIAAAAYYAAVLFLLWYAPKKGIRLKLKHAAIAMLIVMILCLLGSLRPACLEVVFLDVGQGDCAFISSCEGKNVLIDGGGSTNPVMNSRVGELTVVPFLLDRGAGSLDAVIATHAHSDHIQGLMDVLKTIKVKRLIIPSLDDDTCFCELLALAEERSIPVSRCSSGEIIRLDDHTSMYVLSPSAGCPADMDSLNNTSLVLSLCYGETSILLTGDAECGAEEKLIADSSIHPLLDTDVIKIGHHGSNSSTCAAFLEIVSPEAAIISTGKNNFGHPSEEVLERLSAYDVLCFRTDECGAVILRSNGKKIIVKRTVR